MITRKIVLIGAAESGKSQIVNRLRGPQYPFSDDYSPTTGAAWRKVDVKRANSDLIQRLDIWDTGGQDRYASLMPMYLGGIDGNGAVIFTLDPMKSFSAQANHLEEIQKLCQLRDVKGPIILAVTKTDIPEDKWYPGFNRAEVGKLGKRLGIIDKEEDVVYCSAQSGAGIDKIRDRVTAIQPELQRQMEEVQFLQNYVETEIISILQNEERRLLQNYGVPQAEASGAPPVTDEIARKRLEAIHATMQGLRTVVDEAQSKIRPISDKAGIQSALEQTIRNNLDNFDKRKGDWGKKLARALLNVLFACTLFILPGIKKAATGTAFFSLEGKTAAAGEEALEKASHFTANLRKGKAGQ